MCGRIFIKVENGKCYEGDCGVFREVPEERTMKLVKANDMNFKESFTQEFDRKMLSVDSVTLKIVRIL